MIVDAIANTKFNTSCKLLILPADSMFVLSKFCTNYCQRLSSSFIYATPTLSPMLSTGSGERGEGFVTRGVKDLLSAF